MQLEPEDRTNSHLHLTRRDAEQRIAPYYLAFYKTIGSRHLESERTVNS
jgi:hypothetical protein